MYDVCHDRSAVSVHCYSMMSEQESLLNSLPNSKFREVRNDVIFSTHTNIEPEWKKFWNLDRLTGFRKFLTMQHIMNPGTVSIPQTCPFAFQTLMYKLQHCTSFKDNLFDVAL